MSGRAGRILVVGGGGREHALCWKISTDRPEVELTAAPGNAGIARIARTVPIDAEDIHALVGWCAMNEPDLVVVGPDDPLAAGVVDALDAAGVRAFGPTAAAARIESSKAWAAEVCAAAGVPMPATHVFDDPDAADAFVRQRGRPMVVKTDGLAKGKGVIVATDVGRTLHAIDLLARRRLHGAAGDRLVLQELLRGRELSVFAMSDGHTSRVIGAARDYKRIGDGDAGPNTGGMGAYTPVGDADEATLGAIQADIIDPVLAELRDRGAPFVGFLYAGLMLTDEGPKVIEFNARMGDPEAQVVMPTLGFDLVDAMEAAIDGRLAEIEATPPTGAAVCVVLASDGYPGTYTKGRPISGLDLPSAETLVFHAGTSVDGARTVTSGGRVLGVTGLGETVDEARARAYLGAEQVRFEGAVRRSDIATGHI